MKIGVNALFLIPSEVGGSETVVRQTLLALARQLSDSDELIVFLNAENRNVLLRDLRKEPHVRLVDTNVRASSRIRRFLFESFILPRLLRAAGADVLWNPGNTALLHAPCPQLTTIYDLQYKHFPTDFNRTTLRTLKTLVPLSARKSQIILTISEFSRHELVDFLHVPFEKIRVARLAADDSFATELPGEFLAERVMTLTHYPNPFILVVANSYTHKNLETAVHAFRLIADDFPNHRLVIIGRPRHGEPFLRQAIEELPDSSRVTRISYIEHKDLVALFQRAEVLLFPSLHEGFGLPILEAFCCGLPVICCRETAIPEVAGECALYAKSANPEDFARHLRAVLADTPEASALRRQLSEKGRARAQEFSWTESASVLLNAARAITQKGEESTAQKLSNQIAD